MRKYLDKLTYLVLVLLLASSRVDAGDVTTRCQQVTAKSWKELSSQFSSQWRGRELIAFASWCSSCKEKILAAKRAGIKEIILCLQNEKDILDIDQSYLKGMTFHYVQNMFEVLDLALTSEKVKNPIDLDKK